MLEELGGVVASGWGGGELVADGQQSQEQQ